MLKPALVARYIRNMEALAASIAENGYVSEEAKKHLRAIVSTVTVCPPKAGEPPSIALDGCLSNLVDQGLNQRLSVRGRAMVAGDRPILKRFGRD
ncbi:hypothetical protein NMG46_24695 [Mesorhizobium sp. LMG 17147]|uniref:hypothetical protein n=1 Tax=Mesorhizobium sp. LMG 17147 TaxID=2963091 RepID=UPI0020C96094|nr:hypothetical protein [Mesorhizobium sp. LMG 17147]MCP9233394.1 hypothetical protein [Mesorhizobium sp. LMG 17147]